MVIYNTSQAKHTPLMAVNVFPSLIYFLLLLLPVLTLLILNHYTRKLKQSKLPPGPPKLPIIGNLHQLGKIPHYSLFQLSKKYGPIMLLHLGRVPTLVVSSAELAKQVLKTQDLDCCSRPLHVGSKRLSYNFLDIAFSPYSHNWRELRKLCILELFSTKRVQSFRPLREKEVASFIKSISQASSSSVINLRERLSSLLEGIICKIAFGNSFQGRELDISRFLEVKTEALAILGGSSASDLFGPIGLIWDTFSGYHARIDKIFHELDDFYQQVIDDHLDPNRLQPETEDIIDVMLRLQKDESNVIHITKEHIKAMIMNIFLGGSTSPVVTIEWAMVELIKNPRVMKIAQAEIRSYIGRKGMVNESDLVQLQYLQMVLKETLRLHAPGTLLIPRETVRHCKINGYDIYPKTRLYVNVWSLARDPNYWDNPNEFRPERFENKSIDFKGQHFEFLPFGAGRRACPAIYMGTVIMELTLANLLCGFDWELPYGMAKEDINMDDVVCGVSVQKKTALELVPIHYF